MQRLPCVRDRSRIGRYAPGLGLALLLAAAGSATAASAPTPKAAPEATATAILNSAVDELWERSDRFFHNGDYETVSRVNRLVIRLDPNFVEAINTNAWLLRQGLQRPKEALALHHRAIRDNPRSWEAHLDLGMYYFDYGNACLGRRSRLLAALEQRADKDSVEAARQRAQAEEELRQAKTYLELSLPYLRAVVDLDGPQVKQHLLAHAYDKLGRRADAIAAWKQIVEKFPDDLPARRNLERLERAE